jgi:hypothetical protein
MTAVVSGHFASSYADARAKFRAAAAARGLAVVSYALPGVRGPSGEELATDLALLGDPKAPALLLLTSATHGVEGFCGSGCQVALLHDEAFVAAVPSSRVAVLFYHALNPYGFAHLRRTNEDNVDLNRNFRDFSVVPARNDAYAEVHAFAVPDDWPPSAENEARVRAYIARHGAKAFQAAVTGGQCEFADGLFFGGVRPTWSNHTLRAVLREHASQRRRLGWIDFHTGLGPWGHGEKIYSGPNDAATMDRARRWWGIDVTSFYDGTSTSAPLTGVTFHAALEECAGAEYTGIALEYGTLPLEQTLQALRADQWLHNHPDAGAEVRASIKRAIRDTFYGDSDEWRAMVFAQARAAALQALSGLAYSGMSAPRRLFALTTSHGPERDLPRP